VSRTASAPPGPTLSPRALNRATLARQLLLARAPLSIEDAVAHLVGMQGQAPQAPYIGLWTRLEDFRAEELSQLLLDRRVVRIAVMRGTVHLVTAADCLALRPLTQPILDRDVRVNTTHAPQLRDVDLSELAAAGRALVEERPRTMPELGAALSQRWPGRAPGSLAYAVRDLLPLVQVPPRGLWRASGQPTLTTAESWLGRPTAGADATVMVTRYLGAFGPATVQDAQAWSGLTGLGKVFDRLRGDLLTFRDEQGRELFDLPDAPRPDPDTPAPVRFLAEFDNIVLSHADRTRIISTTDWKAIAASRLPPRPVLVDGYTRATWKIESGRLLIAPFVPLTKANRTALTREGRRLLEFAAPEAGTHEVAFTDS